MSLHSIEEYLNIAKAYPRLFANPDLESILRIVLDVGEIREWQAAKLLESGQEELPEQFEIGLLLDDPWYWILRDLVEFPGGERNGYIRFVNKKSVGGPSNVIVVPRLEKKLILLQHFRHETRGISLEFPRGFAEFGLNALENAIKELKEETGLDATKIVRIGNLKAPDGETTFFLADVGGSLADIKVQLSEGVVGFKVVNENKFKQLVLSGEIVDLYTLAASLFLLA